MKKVLNVNIGGKAFVLDEDAYRKLDAYTKEYRAKAGMGYQSQEVMDELEIRIAEILMEGLRGGQEVVTAGMVNTVIARLGMPDGSEPLGGDYYRETGYETTEGPVKKLFRDVDHKVFGGVCSGLACYFNLDILVVRILFVMFLIFGSLGFWIYICLWIAVPPANTAAEKCQMRGIPATAENMRRFYNDSNKNR